MIWFVCWHNALNCDQGHGKWEIERYDKNTQQHQYFRFLYILILWNIAARFCLLWLKCVFRGIFNEFKQFFLKFKSITILKLTSSDWFYLTFSPCLIRFWLKIDSDLKIRFIHWVWVLNVECLCCVRSWKSVVIYLWSVKMLHFFSID